VSPAGAASRTSSKPVTARSVGTRSPRCRATSSAASAYTSVVQAIAALEVARQRGLRVPTDLAVTGFDDVREAAPAGLTTVRQPMLDKGRAAGRLLLDDAEGAEARRVQLPTDLVVRSSTGPARTG